ncbi:MAG: DNA topoisomerase IV subunit A [Deltaproteobacteria bacterium]|nr:DNA topoisomerase IV subunit A [Deltaproteobacteria bacterium]
MAKQRSNPKTQQLDLMNWSQARGQKMTGLEPLMQQNFLEYASYVIVDRAIPDLRDGFKPVQRRILHTLHEADDGRFHKVANIIGETMKLHPHGDASIGDALVVLANKEYFIERQGNFGNVITGHRAAAARYIECRLTDLARETLFNQPLTEFVDSYDGRKQEPVFLPVKLPVALMIGVEGIAVGMSTRVLPHNLPELWRAQIAILKKEAFEVLPDFPHGGVMDVSEYQDGLGKVRVRARIETRSSKKVVITEIPYGTTTESVIASIEAASQKGRVKVSSIDDFTTDAVEIELTLARGVDADEALPQLFAYTDCEVSINSNIVVIVGKRPEELTVPQMLLGLTAQLKELIKAELEYELSKLEDKQHFMTLERIFVEERVYKRIEAAKSEKKVRDEVWHGMHEHEDRFVREMVEEDVKRLLALAIRRISLFDIEKHKKDLEELLRSIRGIKGKLRSITKTTIGYIEGLLEKYGDRYPRLTEIDSFETVDKRAVSRQNIRLSYDPKTQLFGSEVRGSEYALTVSEYDRVLAICDDGSYRIMQAPQKTYLPGKVLYLAIFEIDDGVSFYVVYRDGQKTAYAKLVHILKFIKDKEYQLCKGEGSKVDLLLPAFADEGPPGELHLKFVAAKRQRLKETTYDLAELEFIGVGARGVRLAPKPVGRIKLLRKKAEPTE